VVRLLVVEDEDEIRSILIELLHEAGYDVIAAPTGDDAFVLLQTAPAFDALVTDIHMPGRLDGLALARLFREQYPESPIVYVTGNPGVLRETAMRNGKDAVLPKPYWFPALSRALRALLAAESRACHSAAA
jgi:CheY-like chemotaxis protein